MIDSQQKHEALREAREKDKREEAIETLKEYGVGKNKGRAQKTIRNVKDLAKNATPMGLFSLLFQANIFSDWMYGLALLAAIFKDILDFIAVTGILYGIAVVVTFLTSIFIAMMMMLGSFSNGVGRSEQKMIRSWLVLLSGTTVEILFGLSFLPVETLTVFIIYALVLLGRKQTDNNRESLPAHMQENYA